MLNLLYQSNLILNPNPIVRTLHALQMGKGLGFYDPLASHREALKNKIAPDIDRMMFQPDRNYRLEVWVEGQAIPLEQDRLGGPLIPFLQRHLPDAIRQGLYLWDRFIPPPLLSEYVLLPGDAYGLKPQSAGTPQEQARRIQQMLGESPHEEVPPPGSGLEEGGKIDLAELEESDDSNARQLAKDARAAGYSQVVLIPDESLKKAAVPEGVTVHLYAHEGVMAGAVAALPIPLDSIVRHTLSEEIQTAREELGNIPRDQVAVVALDAAFKDRLSELLPEDHPLTFLLDSWWENNMNYQREISVLLSQPAGTTRNLVLYLSAGSVRAVQIGGRNFTAIFA